MPDVDYYSRLPFGVMHFGSVASAKEEVKVFEQLDVIEKQAEAMFGKYAVDVDGRTVGRRGERVVCTRVGTLGVSRYALAAFMNLQQREQEEELRKICGNRVGMRGGFAVLSE